MEILALDIEDKPEIEDESSTLLITTNQLANSASKEESGVIGNISSNFNNTIANQSSAFMILLHHF